MAEGHKKIDPNSIPGLVIVVREEQLSTRRELSQLIKRIDALERTVEKLKEKVPKEDHDEHDISSG